MAQLEMMRVIESHDSPGADNIVTTIQQGSVNLHILETKKSSGWQPWY